MELNENEEFLLKILNDNQGKMSYKELNKICAEKFEGVRLVLKKLKDTGYVYYEGIIPGFDSIIETLKK
ncbi:MAG: hypothetical protein ACTSRG_06310 [Candidatus Helarchaeota archaeon]